MQQDQEIQGQGKGQMHVHCKCAEAEGQENVTYRESFTFETMNEVKIQM